MPYAASEARVRCPDPQPFNQRAKLRRIAQRHRARAGLIVIGSLSFLIAMGYYQASPTAHVWRSVSSRHPAVPPAAGFNTRHMPWG